MSDRGPMGANHHEQKQRLYLRQLGRCLGCDVRTPYAELTRHHVILYIRGGPDTDGNICLLCEKCHARCHHANSRVQHDALRPILIAFGFPPKARSAIYVMYRRYGVFDPHLNRHSPEKQA